MHPRTRIRSALQSTISGITDAPTYVSRVRDLRRGEDTAVMIYTTSESISRPPGGGDIRPGLPVQREISIEIVVLAKSLIDDNDTAAGADDLCRKIEIAINDTHPELALIGADQGYSTADTATVITTLRYTVSCLDILTD